MSESNPSSLSENAVGAIAYLSPVPAIAFLVLVPYKKSSYVRFHAWQSIFLTFVALIVSWLLEILVESSGLLGAQPFQARHNTRHAALVVSVDSLRAQSSERQAF